VRARTDAGGTPGWPRLLRVTRQAVARAAIPGLLLGVSHVVRAGDLVIDYFVGSTVEVTDNLNLTSTNREAAVINTQQLGTNVRQTGARSSLALDYRLDLETTNGDIGSLDAQNNVQGIGEIELLEDLFFVDAQVITRRALVDPGGRVGSSERVGSGNQASVTTIDLAPSLRQTLGQYGDGELTHRHRQVFVEGSAASNRTTMTDSLRLNSGPRVLDWIRLSSLLERSETDADQDRSDIKRDTAELSSFLPLSAEFALLSMGGYEKIDTQTNLQESDGLIWSIGFDWHPTPNTSLVLTGGERFGGTNISGQLSYKLSSRLAFKAGYAESVGTGLDADQFGGLGLATGLEPGLRRGQIFDTRTGLPVDQGDIGLGLRDDVFMSRRLTASLVATYPRDTITLTVVSETRESDTRPEQTIKTFLGLYTRRLQRDLDLDVSLSYRDADSNSATASSGSSSQTVLGRAALRQRLTENLTGSVAYTRAQRFSETSTDEYTENAVLVAIRQAF
jgi:uncharacterized protein (PEP-CTERM system associated)